MQSVLIFAILLFLMLVETYSVDFMSHSQFENPALNVSASQALMLGSYLMQPNFSESPQPSAWL